MISIKLRRRHAVCLGAFLVVLSSTGLTCAAQAKTPLEQCFDKAGPQFELNVCASEEAKRADNELNIVYKKLMIKYAKDPIALAKMKAFERSWVIYRHAYLDATYPAEDKQVNYGSIFPMEWGLLYAEITRSQIKVLNDLISDNKIE